MIGEIKMSNHTIELAKTYNSGDSPVVTHLTTSPPVRCLNRAERTGSLVFNVLWSYVTDRLFLYYHICMLYLVALSSMLQFLVPHVVLCSILAKISFPSLVVANLEAGRVLPSRLLRVESV
jgi:hypothetical protein